MEDLSIHSAMKAVLIGKELKYVKLRKQIEQSYIVLSKRDKSVTQKQFEGGNERFIKAVERFKTIGSHTIYETSKLLMLLSLMVIIMKVTH